MNSLSAGKPPGNGPVATAVAVALLASLAGCASPPERPSRKPREADRPAPEATQRKPATSPAPEATEGTPATPPAPEAIRRKPATSPGAEAKEPPPYVLSRPCPGGKEYFVDAGHPGASDSGPGTRQVPLKTISKAAEVSRAGDVVTIGPGVYRETVRLSQTGTRQRPIVFQARSKGTAIVTGADPLTGWRKEAGPKPVYSVPWSHDFIINATIVDGRKVLIRNHGADAPTGCAEQVIWDGRPQQQVMSRDAMGPGTFCVDWEADRLFVWLPGGIDPSTTEVLGSTRSLQFGRAGYWANWADAKYITVKGLTFRYAANFAQRGGLKFYSGWRVEDCVAEWNNGGGVVGEGEGIVLLRVTAQDNGFSGIAGDKVRGALVEDCVSRRNNRKGFPVMREGGGGKWLNTDGLRIVGHTAYGNVGPGIWLDWDNRNYSIESCTSFANYGNTHVWEGIGIFTEANDGPGRIVNNTVYSNTGSGILIAESQRVVVEGNVVVDCRESIGLRAMEGREQHKLENVVVKGNSFKDWRLAAVSTDLGTWSRSSPADKRIEIDGNTYDPPEGKPLYNWSGEKLERFADVQGALGLERAGSVAEVPFAEKLVATKTVAARASFGIEEVLADARAGDTVFLPANGRTSISKVAGGWRCQVYDLANTYVDLMLPDDRVKQKVESVVTPFPMTEATFLKARLTRRDAERIEATVLELGDEVERQALAEIDRRRAAASKRTWLNAYPLAREAAPGDWNVLDLASVANRPIVGEDAWIGIPLEHVEAGRIMIHGVPFEVIDGALNGDMVGVGLRCERFTATRGKPLPREVEVLLGSRAKAVYFLHACGWAPKHEKVAGYEFVYADGTRRVVDIIPYGKADLSAVPGTAQAGADRAGRLVAESTIQDWWPDFPQFDNENARRALVSDETGEYRRFLYTLQWVNPEPEKAVERIRLASEPGKEAFVLVLGITALAD
jgi:parallel beta-helix repeat protein